MATERATHQRWADSQRDALLELGYDLADIERRLKWILDNLPPGADPAEYIFPSDAIWQEPSDPEQEMDSRVAWISDATVPARFKLMPDAKAEYAK